jgi:hypothetical protein
MTRLRIREKFTPHDSGAEPVTRELVDPHAMTLQRNEKVMLVTGSGQQTTCYQTRFIYLFGVLEAIEMNNALRSNPLLERN